MATPKARVRVQLLDRLMRPQDLPAQGSRLGQRDLLLLESRHFQRVFRQVPPTSPRMGDG